MGYISERQHEPRPQMSKILDKYHGGAVRAFRQELLTKFAARLGRGTGRMSPLGDTGKSKAPPRGPEGKGEDFRCQKFWQQAPAREAP